MIVKNEAQNLRELLPAIRHLFDKIVIVDTGSTDDTAQVAEECGARVHHYEWQNDFAAARNYSFSCCMSDWIMWLDADDRLTPESIANLQRFIQYELPAIDKTVILIDYRINLQEDGSWHMIHSRSRIIHRLHPTKWEGKIHEGIKWQAGEEYRITDITVDHTGNNTHHLPRNLEIHQAIWDSGKMTSREIYHYGQDALLSGQYQKAIEILGYYNIDNESGAEKYWVPIFLGNAHEALGRRLTALQHYLMAITLSPMKAEAWIECAKLFIRAGDFGNAVPFLSAIQCLYPPTDGTPFRLKDYDTAFTRACLNDCIDKYNQEEEKKDGQDSEPQVPGYDGGNINDGDMHRTTCAV